MYAQSADILDVCHVHAAAFLYVCSELSHVIPPGARQLKGARLQKNRGKTPRGGGDSTRRAPPLPDWNQQRFGLELGSVSELGPSAPRLLSPRCSSKNTKSWNLDCNNPHEPRTWNIQAGNVEKQVTLLQIFRPYTTQHSTPLLRFQLCWLYINNAACFDKIDTFQSRGRVRLMGSRTHNRPVW